MINAFCDQIGCSYYEKILTGRFVKPNMLDFLTFPKWPPQEIRESKLQYLLHQIRSAGRNRRYDCILGVSGGIDSTYLTYLAGRDWKLRILLVHVNAGWNTEVAEANIRKLIDKLRLDLYQYHVAWEEMRDLQLAFLPSGVTNLDVPQDHSIFPAFRALKRYIR